MARKIRSASLENRGDRLALGVRKKVYTVRVANGIRLAYRRNKSGGVWSVQKSDGAGGAPLQRFALADDHEDANGSTILDYWQACDMARKLARGDDGAAAVEGGLPASVSKAVDAYERDLRARDGGRGNATILRYHLPSSIMSKPVSLLTAREIRTVREALIEKGCARSTANRFMKALAACLNLAAADDERIGNAKAWKLPGLPDSARARNVILTDQMVTAVVEACYQMGGERFGLYIELMATSGARGSQLRRLTVADLEADHPSGPRVQMPSSKKGGRGQKRVARAPLPIPVGLAARLAAEAEGRADDEPLLRIVGKDGPPFAVAAAAAKLPPGATPYSLRHSSITRQLLRGIPVRLVAAGHDTGVQQIEAHYSKYIAQPGADLVRGALLDFDATPLAANVVPIGRKSTKG